MFAELHDVPLAMQVSMILPIHSVVPKLRLTTVSISIVLALNTVWFISHLSQLYQKKGKAKIHLTYILFHMVSATEQLNLCYYNSMFLAERGRIEAFAKDSRNWMHLFQVTTIWMIFSLVM